MYVFVCLQDLQPQVRTRTNFLIPSANFLPTRFYGKQVSQKKIKKGYSSASESDSDDEHETRPRVNTELYINILTYICIAWLRIKTLLTK